MTKVVGVQIPEQLWVGVEQRVRKEFETMPKRATVVRMLLGAYVDGKFALKDEQKTDNFPIPVESPLPSPVKQEIVETAKEDEGDFGAFCDTVIQPMMKEAESALNKLTLVEVIRLYWIIYKIYYCAKEVAK